MAIAAVVTVGIFGVTVAMLFFLAAGSAKDQVTRLAPDYAKRLYCSRGESFFSRVPVRLAVLFGEAVPPEVIGWVQPIRITGGLTMGLAVLFIVIVVSQL